jgi:hypothetical protein
MPERLTRTHLEGPHLFIISGIDRLIGNGQANRSSEVERSKCSILPEKSTGAGISGSKSMEVCCDNDSRRGRFLCSSAC